MEREEIERQLHALLCRMRRMEPVQPTGALRTLEEAERWLKTAREQMEQKLAERGKKEALRLEKKPATKLEQAPGLLIDEAQLPPLALPREEIACIPETAKGAPSQPAEGAPATGLPEKPEIKMEHMRLSSAAAMADAPAQPTEGKEAPPEKNGDMAADIKRDPLSGAGAKEQPGEENRLFAFYRALEAAMQPTDKLEAPLFEVDGKEVRLPPRQ